MLFQFGPANPAQDRDYWLDRAAAHLDLGERAPDTRASWAHFQLAGQYLDRAYGGGWTAPADQLIVAELIEA